MEEFSVTIKPLTQIWTGDANGKNSSLRETGIIGSLRWWYEALIRGLGGYACDPTDESLRCKLEHDKFNMALKSGKTMSEALNEQICSACQLFGCTGWSRKFKLQVLDNHGNSKTNAIDDKNEEKKEEIVLKFIPLRKIENEELALLNLTLYLIAKYGALGGKTVFKPSDELNGKNKLHHQDFGLIDITASNLKMLTKEQLQAYVRDNRWRKPQKDYSFAWVSIQNFWCVNGKYLYRENANESSFNKALGRKESKNISSQLEKTNDKVSKWLAGSQQESKKVFSFKNPPRTFGFVKPDIVNFEQMKERLKSVWGNENNWKFLKGDDIVDSLIQELLEGLK